MSSLEAKKIAPATGTTVTLGAAGDTVDVSATALKTNTIKDAGGNTLFTSDGSGTLSSVNSALKGGLIFISSQTASGSASIEFTTGLTSAYNEYVFFFTNINPATEDYNFTFNGSIDGGSNYNVTKTTTVFTAYHSESGSYTALGYDATRDLAQSASFQQLGWNIGSGADESLAGEFHLFNPTSTTYVKQFYGKSSYYYSSDYAFITYVAGYFNDTNDVDAMQFKMSSGNFDGTVAMYGTG